MGCTHGCGSCCDPVILSEGFVHRAFAFGPAQPQAEWIWANWEPITVEETGSAQLRCINYDVATRACLAYDTRPPVCRDFPFYGKPPALENGPRSNICGYQAEMGRTVLPLVAVT
jgi:Fe-S-cluster containining protein